MVYCLDCSRRWQWKSWFWPWKAREVPIAIQKAMEAARKNMIDIELNGNTLWYPITARHSASKVYMQPLPRVQE